ncbi:aspartate kinase [Candidatus Woesearchaeota archaeon]|nr:aspartate kinase [Candidatus Woesearchaeota archaeon]
MIVMKFGGSSVGSAEAIKKTCSIVINNIEKQPYVVVSALSGITDLLISSAKTAKSGDMEALGKIKDTHKEVISALNLDPKIVDQELEELETTLKGIAYLHELTDRTMDTIMSFGERCSSKIIAAYLTAQGHKSSAFTGWDAGIITDSVHKNASYLADSYDRIAERMKNLDVLPVITGFIAHDADGEITTLGRGGSDLTASIIGVGIDADEIQIWTDVDGVMTCDPRICSNARTLPTMSFREASELAYFGAKILHPKTIQPAVKKNIPVVVKNTFNPEFDGTRVIESKVKGNTISGIALKRNVTVITIVSSRMLDAHGFISKIFKVFDDLKISVDMVATSEVSVSITLDGENGCRYDVIAELSKLGEVKCESDNAIICVVGDGIEDNPRLKGRIINAITSNDIIIKMISQGASSINVGLVVKGSDAEKAAKLLHDELIDSE